MDAADWDEHYRGHEHQRGREPSPYIRQHCERLPVGEAVDLACGEGRHAVWLARLGWRVTGVDFSTVAIERAREMTAQQAHLHALRLAWRLEDVGRMELKPASVDLALVSDLHLPSTQRDDLLVLAAQALRPRGHLVVVDHHQRPLVGDVEGSHDHLYRPEQVKALLTQSCGLVVEVARTVETPTADGVARDTVIRARRDPAP